MEFPNIFILDGGYNGFWKKNFGPCEPVGYIKMDGHPSCKELMKAFNKKMLHRVFYDDN